jgi:hypothetical protein
MDWESAEPDYWQLKCANGKWRGIDYQGMLQAEKEGYEVRPLYAFQLDLTLYTELYLLREEVKGPDGFQTWKDAAIFERGRRVALEGLASEIDYLAAMGAFHSDKWHKMDPITGYMHGWNACVAEVKRLNAPRTAQIQPICATGGAEWVNPVPRELQQVLLELRTYNPKADEYGGKYIIPGWADRIEKALGISSSASEEG